MQTYDLRKGTLIWLIPGRAAGQCTVFWLAMNRKYNLFCLCPKQFGILEGAGREEVLNIAITAFKSFLLYLI